MSENSGIKPETATRADLRILAVPLVIWMAVTCILVITDSDLAVAGLFWRDNEGWYLGDHWAVNLLYHYGTWPTLCVGLVAGILWLSSWKMPQFRKTRTLCVFLVLLLVLGPGILVNGVLKKAFSRPRPRQVQQFGGDRTYRAFPGLPGGVPARSFPSGHASMGLYWLGLFVYFWFRSKVWAWTFACAGAVHGGVLGWARMADGGHWLTDIWWSAGLIYALALLLCWRSFRNVTRREVGPPC